MPSLHFARETVVQRPERRQARVKTVNITILNIIIIGNTIDFLGNLWLYDALIILCMLFFFCVLVELISPKKKKNPHKTKHVFLLIVDKGA